MRHYLCRYTATMELAQDGFAVAVSGLHGDERASVVAEEIRTTAASRKRSWPM